MVGSIAAGGGGFGFFADRAEARLETSRRAYSGLDPLSSALRAFLWVSDPYGKLTE